jgi:hypothetical protein
MGTPSNWIPVNIEQEIYDLLLEAGWKFLDRSMTEVPGDGPWECLSVKFQYWITSDRPSMGRLLAYREWRTK